LATSKPFLALPGVPDFMAMDDNVCSLALSWQLEESPMNMPHKHPPGREPPDLPPKPEPEPDTKASRV
jgi:hypothetical protein